MFDSESQHGQPKTGLWIRRENTRTDPSEQIDIDVSLKSATAKRRPASCVRDVGAPALLPILPFPLATFGIALHERTPLPGF